MIERTLSKDNPVFSPMEPIFAPYGDTVPYALREQFYASPDDPFDVVLKGKMHRVWHKPLWLRPLMRALGKCGILVPEIGRNVPMTLRIIAWRNRSGRPVHIYVRSFYFPKQLVRFRTTVVYNRSLGQTGELVGPRNIILIIWRSRFRPPTTFTLDTVKVAVRIGKRLIWLPDLIWRWALGVVHHSQWTDHDHEDMIHVELMLWQPLVGYFFGYEGTLHLTREPHSVRTSVEPPLEWTRDMAECTM